MNKLQAAAELRKALQIFLATLDPDEYADTIIEVPTVFPVWQVDKAYKAKDVFSYGLNGVGDPQLYQVLQDHTSQADWTPDTATSLYKAIGISPSGYPEWVQPVGASDAYTKGDIVSHQDTLWISDVDANVWEPSVFGWSPYSE